ncbi:endonuclease [Blastopirellula marina]|uniref:Endonuclease I n=1 Tax=Blastopirellula marina DSM 3645 TaxID=314230 RepID=A4A239_9BACT|nr:endonuclease [Blastopirellula marina]EAQ77142.1 hypothetical protein DSM3645_15100 [Blastopirellula marina DSM 3645]
MRQMLLLALLLVIPYSSASADEIFPGKSGEELAQVLRSEFTPTNRLDYFEARREMFSRIDNFDGKVLLVYTGEKFPTSDIPDHTVVNTEHTWPQSKFANANSRNEMKTDLHHLFATRNPVNSDRGNKPFGDIPDDVSQRWWNSDSPSGDLPGLDERDNFSESSDNLFEPREAHKGNVARAMLYFYTVYGNRNIDKAWFEPQIPTLLAWHGTPLRIWAMAAA